MPLLALGAEMKKNTRIILCLIVAGIMLALVTLLINRNVFFFIKQDSCCYASRAKGISDRCDDGGGVCK